jgi:hypothetical protein
MMCDVLAGLCRLPGHPCGPAGTRAQGLLSLCVRSTDISRGGACRALAVVMVMHCCSVLPCMEKPALQQHLARAGCSIDATLHVSGCKGVPCCCSWKLMLLDANCACATPAALIEALHHDASCTAFRYMWDTGPELPGHAHCILLAAIPCTGGGAGIGRTVRSVSLA